MSTYEELKNRKSLLEKFINFIKSHNGFICIVIGLVCIPILCYTFNTMGLVLKSVVVILSLFFIVNIILFVLSRKNKKIPHVANIPKAILFLFLVIALVFAYQKHESTNVVIFTTVVVLCLINYAFSLTYQKYWNVPDDLLRKLVKIEVLAVVIALLQLVIAFPQLRLAYESATSADVVGFKTTVENYYKTIEGSRFVEIPDSLHNIEVIRAKEYQQKIYAYSLYILHADLDYDIDIKEISAKSDTVSTILSTNGVAKKNQNAFADATNYLLRMPHYRNLTLKYISQFKTINNLVALVDSINDYYSKSDSSLISTQLNQKGLEGLKSYMITQEINQNALCKQLNQMHERIEDSKSLDFSSQSRIRYEESEKIRKCLEKLLKDGSFEKTVDSVYNLSLDFINILNLVQLKYAYNIDL